MSARFCDDHDDGDDVGENEGDKDDDSLYKIVSRS